MKLRMSGQTKPTIAWVAIAVGAAALVVLVIVVLPWLLTRYPHRGLTADQALKAKNDVRTTLVQALAGIAVAGGLVVTYRTYRLSKSQQVTQTYTKAIEQLGHTDAPVRLGALYSLEQLGQDNPDRRQTVVDVLCAYLRMPYTPPPAADPHNEASPAASADPLPVRRHDPQQELQVRKTAQRLLANHLHPPSGTRAENAVHIRPSSQLAFWPGLSIDLAGATLVEFDLSRAIVQADLRRATFTGNALFDEATFIGNALFDEATFTGDASFYEATFSEGAFFHRATFTGDAWFGRATFTGNASFDNATFTRGAAFDEATFTRDAWFDEAAFTRDAWFGEATFTRDAWFGEATFTGDAGFRATTFTGDASFYDATFTGNASFEDATFTGNATFHDATFTGNAWFEEATFTNGAAFDGACVLNLDISHGRCWPHGWAVRVDSDDPTSGQLVRSDPAPPCEPDTTMSTDHEDGDAQSTGVSG
jgi:Pentapeptide repeats (9 copies)